MESRHPYYGVSTGGFATSARPNIAIVINLDYPLKRHHEVYAAIQRYCVEHDWGYSNWPYAPIGLRTPKAGGRRRKSHFDGVIARASKELHAACAKASIPLVNVWHGSPVADRVTTVAFDPYAVGVRAAEHLRGRGFSRFAFVGFQKNEASRRMEAGLRDETGLVRGGYPRLLVSTAFSERQVYWDRFQRDVERWLPSLKPPIGLFVIDDNLARNIANAVIARGMRVPEDVALIGVQNEQVLCLTAAPTLTSIELNYDAIGTSAARALEILMNGGPPPPPATLIQPGQLIARESTDAYPVDDPLVSEVLRYMADACSKPITVGQIAAAFPVSPHTLARRFKAARGCRVGEELARMRVLRARRLLVESDMAIKEVAQACGYADSTRLGEATRRILGVSPGACRRGEL